MTTDAMSLAWRNHTCARCGEGYTTCRHINTMRLTSEFQPGQIARIRAAYAFGKQFNPDHDTTSYYLQTLNPPPIEE